MSILIYMKASPGRERFYSTAAAKMKPWLYVPVIIMILAFPVTVLAKSPVNTNWRGVAVKGYDTVAYFTESRPVKGKKEFEYRWQDVKWRFANARHLEMFKANPEKYAPQYGGY